MGCRTAPRRWNGANGWLCPTTACRPSWNVCAPAAVEEAVVLSTCNRVEVYAVTEADDAVRLRGEVAQWHSDPRLAETFYQHDDDAAVRHLFRVAAGLDSLVIGEAEILGQVKRAYDLAKQAGATGKLTNVLFQRAMYVGKAVRTQTKISEGPTSVPSLAVSLAERIFGDLAACRALVVGAGAMAELPAGAQKPKGGGTRCRQPHGGKSRGPGPGHRGPRGALRRLKQGARPRRHRAVLDGLARIHFPRAAGGRGPPRAAGPVALFHRHRGAPRRRPRRGRPGQRVPVQRRRFGGPGGREPRPPGNGNPSGGGVWPTSRPGNSRPGTNPGGPASARPCVTATATWRPPKWRPTDDAPAHRHPGQALWHWPNRTTSKPGSRPFRRKWRWIC
ncbi:MAG: hypothetical protein IPH91_10790 [Elusimicrobia bacterium]|nr:hypothetical protein [Elusimicrobiota bacterium]